jgi:hypothetical protein
VQAALVARPATGLCSLLSMRFLTLLRSISAKTFSYRKKQSQSTGILSRVLEESQSAVMKNLVRFLKKIHF